METKKPQPSEAQSAATSGQSQDAPRPGALHSQPQIDDDLFCPECGYNLRGLTSDRCPECGTDIGFVRRRESLIPWTYRDKLGFFRAYWRTAWMVVANNRRFCLEMSRPIDYPQANRFRWATVIQAYVPFVLLTAVLFLIEAVPPGTEPVVWTIVIHAAIFICFATLTAVPYYTLSHKDVPLERQLRAATLTLYGSAPLACMFVVIVFVIGGLIIAEFSNMGWDLILYALAAGAFLMILALMLIDLERIIKRMLQEEKPVYWILGKLQTVWFVAFVVTLVGIPLTAVFLAIVYISLR